VRRERRSRNQHHDTDEKNRETICARRTVKVKAESEELLSAVPHARSLASFAVHGSLSHHHRTRDRAPHGRHPGFRHGGGINETSDSA